MGKNRLADFSIYILLFVNWICPFPIWNICQPQVHAKKAIKGATKPHKSKEKQGKKESKKERSKLKKRKTKEDNTNFGFKAHMPRAKKLLNYVRLVRKYALIVAKIIFCPSHANVPNSVQIRVNVEKNVFFLLHLTGHGQRIKPLYNYAKMFLCRFYFSEFCLF